MRILLASTVPFWGVQNVTPAVQEPVTREAQLQGWIDNGNLKAVSASLDLKNGENELANRLGFPNATELQRQMRNPEFRQFILISLQSLCRTTQQGGTEHPTGHHPDGVLACHAGMACRKEEGDLPEPDEGDDNPTPV